MINKKLKSVFFVVVLIGTIFSVLGTIPSVSSASPTIPTGHNTDISGTITGYIYTSGTYASGSTTLYSTESTSESTFYYSGIPTWSGTGTTTWTSSTLQSGSIQYFGGTSVGIEDIAVKSPYYLSGFQNSVTTYDAISMTVYLTINGNTQSSTYSISSDNTWIYMNANFGSFTSTSGYYSFSYYITIGVNDASGQAPNLVTTTTQYYNNGVTSSQPTTNSVYGYYGWTYSGSSVLVSWNLPSNYQAYSFSYSGQSGTTSTVSSGSHVGTSLPTSATFKQSGNPNVPSYTISWSVSNLVTSTSATFGSSTITQSITENQNWYNSSISYSVSKESGWINGGSYYSKPWNTVLSTYSVSNIISVGYGTSAPIDLMFISGSASYNYNPPAQTESFTQNPSSTQNSAFILSFNIAEFINYQPNTPTITTSYSGIGSKAYINIGTGEQINGEHENILINWGDGVTTPLNNIAFGTQPTQSHTYSGTYQGTFSQSYSPTVTVTNLPNGNPSGNTVQTNSATSSPYTFGLQDTPTTPNTEIVKGQYIWLNVTATNLQPSSASMVVNGLSGGFATLAYQSGNYYDYKYTNSLFGTTGVTVQWTISDSTSITDILTVQYATPLEPNTNSSYVTALFSNSATHSYPVNLTNVPQEGQVPIKVTNSQSNATGVYQQLINFPTSTYKNSINANFSDVYFSYANGTTIPSWIQSNASNTFSSTPIWMKLNSIPASSSIMVYAHIVPNSVFFGQGWANIGSGTTNWNAENVFSFATDFTNSQDFTTITGTPTYSSNGLTLPSGTNTAVYATQSDLSMINKQFYVDATSLPSSNSGGYYGFGINAYGLPGTHALYVKTDSTGSGFVTANATNYNDFGQLPYGSGIYRMTETATTVTGYKNYTQTPYSSTSYIYTDSNNPMEFQANGLGQDISFRYAFIASYLPSVGVSVSTTMQSSNDTTQYYQQEITISTATTGHPPSYYGLNSANSNFQIATNSGTPLYTWIQSYNSTSLTMWTKTPYTVSGSETLQMEVMPSFENLFSANGYLGEAPQLSSVYGQNDNGASVFPYYTDLKSSLPSFFTVSGNVTNYTINDGLKYFSGTVYGAGIYIPINGSGYALGVYASYSTQQIRTGFTSLSGNPISEMSIENWTQTNNMLLFNTNLTGSSSILDNTGLNSNVMRNYEIQQSNGQVSYAINGKEYYFPHTNYHYPLYPNLAYGDASGPMDISYFYLRVNVSMPTASISGSGQIYQSNATNYNTTYQHYATFSPYQYNLTNGEYTYSIPDSFNSNYITIYYNPAWTIEYASYGHSSGIEYFSNGSYMPFITFSGISDIGTLTMTFIEPITIGQPLGTMSLGVSPSVAINRNGFFNLPNGMITWYANGKVINPIGFSVVVGKSLTLTAYASKIPLQISTGNTFSNSITYTPTQYDSYLQTYVNVTELQLNNYNSQYQVQVSAFNSNGTLQQQALLAPSEIGYDVYIPSGIYTFKYAEINQTTGIAVKVFSVDATNYSGQEWINIAGTTIYDVYNHLTFINASIANSIQSLSIQISLNDSQIKNLTVRLNLNLSATNTSIQNVMTQILLNESFISGRIGNISVNETNQFNLLNATLTNLNLNNTAYFKVVNSSITNLNLSDKQYYSLLNDTMHNVNLTMAQQFQVINSTIDKLNLTIYQQVIAGITNISHNETVRYKAVSNLLQNLGITTNLTSGYTLTASSPYYENGLYYVPETITAINGNLATLNETQTVSKNLKIYIINATVDTSYLYKINGLYAGHFTIVLNLSKIIVTQINNGTTSFQLLSGIQAGAITTPVTGYITANTLSNLQKNAWWSYFSNTPPPNMFSSFQNFDAFWGWFYQSALVKPTAILGIASLILGIIFYTRGNLKFNRDEKYKENKPL